MKKSLKSLAIPILALLTSGCIRHDYMAEGRKAMAAREYALADIYFRKAIQKAPSSDKAYFELGQAILKEGRYGPAYAAFSKAASLNPANEQAQDKVGEFYIAAKQPEHAEQLARDMVQRDPNSLLGNVLLGEALGAEQNYRDAFTILSAVTGKYPKSAVPLVPLAAIDFSLGQTDNGLQTLTKAIRLDPHFTAAYVLAASYLKSLGKRDAALKLLRAGTSANPLSASVNLALAGTLEESKADLPEAEKLLTSMAEHGPAKIPAQIRLALLEITLKKYDRATALLQQLDREQHGSDPTVVYDRARLYLAQRKIPEAHKELLALVKLAPGSAEGHYFLGTTSIVLGKWREASRELRTAAQLAPQNTTAYTLLSALELNHQEFQPALSDSEHALALNETNVAAMVIRGQSLMAQHRYQQAEQQYREIQRLAPNAPLAYEHLGQIALLENNYKKAIPEFESALKRAPSLAPALQGLALALSKTDGPQSAIERIRAQIKAEPKHAPFHGLLGDYLAEQSQFDAAVKEYQQALTVDPAYLAAYDGLTNVYQREDKFDLARQAMETALTKNPKYLPALMTLGQMDDRDGHPNRAAARYEKILESNPDFAPAANNLAWDYFETNRNLDTALQLAQRARSLMPNNPSTADTLAAILLKRGLPDNARQLLLQCVKDDPKMVIAHYHLALALLALKDNRNAEEQLHTVIALAPKDPVASKARQVLKSMGRS